MPQMFGLHHRHAKLFLLLCTFPVSVFSYVHFLKGNIVLASILILCTIVFAVSFLKIRQNYIDVKYKVLIVISMWCCLASASYFVGIHGVFYIFPSIIALFFLMPIKACVIISVPSAIIFVLLAIANGEPFITFKLVIPIFLTIAFTAFFAYFSKFQQEAVGKESKIDPLTRIANRHAFNDWLITCYKSKKIKSITTIHLDIDYFGIINDSYGYEVGDKVIKEFASELTSILKANEITEISGPYMVARFSGDIFTLGLTNIPQNFDLSPLVEEMQKAGTKICALAEHSTSLTISAGIVNTRRIEGKFANVMDNTEFALRQAKKLGRNSIIKYDDTVTQQLKEQQFIARELSIALNKNQFHMLFMPIYCGKMQSIIGAELLIRCDWKPLSDYGPDKYIPIAESCGLIEQIDYWVLRESFELISNNIMLRIPCVRFYSINISSHQLHNADFVPYVTRLSEKYGIPLDLIELEITETSLVEADLKAVETLIALKRLGFKLSLDDFGTGFTSFNQLKKYPLDCLKIDRSFVSGDHEVDTPVAGMSEVILSIAKLYDFKVIAEGVETKEQFEALKDQGCHYFQGYWFSKPVPLKEFVYLLTYSSG